jgi:hypothetical protein
MMRRTLNKLLCCIVVAACSVFSTTRAEARHGSVDLSNFTCEAFLQAIADGREEEMRGLAIWLDGYMASIADDKVMNWKNFEQFFDELLVYCRGHGSSNLLEAAHDAGN